MDKLEEMLQQMADKQVVVLEDPRLPRSVKGLYLWDEKQPLIILRPDMDNREKLCILAEEIGHYETATMDMRYCSRYQIARQERLAMERAIQHLVPLRGLEQAVHAYIWTPWDCADYFGITEEMMNQAMDYYQHTSPKELARLKRFACRHSLP
jgi:Zn-dependent peptidase ImmA (M78 family)